MSGLLPQEEVERLIELAHKGDKEAQETLVKGNIALVKSIVGKFIGRGAEFDDLYQVGCMGLVKAVNHFDSGYNVRFSTYAVPMIAGEIKRYLRDDGAVKVSRSLKELASRSAAAAEALKAKLGREPTIEEVAAAVGESPEDVAVAREASRACVSCTSRCSRTTAPFDRPRFLRGQGGRADRQAAVKGTAGHPGAPGAPDHLFALFSGRNSERNRQKARGFQVQVSRLESKIIRKLGKRQSENGLPAAGLPKTPSQGFGAKAPKLESKLTTKAGITDSCTSSRLVAGCADDLENQPAKRPQPALPPEKAIRKAIAFFASPAHKSFFRPPAA